MLFLSTFMCTSYSVRDGVVSLAVGNQSRDHSFCSCRLRSYLHLMIITIYLSGISISVVFQDWDQVETIPDPDAKKPDDWDEDMDGEWEPPMITNPEYKVRLNCSPLEDC